MKMNFNFSVLLFCFSFLSLNAQSYHQKKQITANYNQHKLQELIQKHQDFFRQEQLKIKQALQNNWPLQICYPNGEEAELYRINEWGLPEYRKTFSINSGISIGADHLYPNGSLELNLEGEGLIAGLWDSGKIRGSHELLSGKVNFKDNASIYKDHPTLVGGIIAGKELLSGDGIQAKGTAYKASLDAYDWTNDIAEMTAAAAEGLLISNHSYGKDMEQLGQTMDVVHLFGAYDKQSSDMDEIVYEAPYYTVVVAAGNDRQKDLNPDSEGYNLLGMELSTAKNNIVVAAVHRVTDYSGPEDVTMTSFSNWGPTNDNRIKPDIAADGVDVYTSAAFYPPLDPEGVASDTTYFSAKGTSMAAPAVTGGLLLLQELSSDLNQQQFLKAATLKAIAIHTARQADPVPGPNPRSGWGLLNLKAAAELMLTDYETNKEGAKFYDELVLLDQGSYAKTILADGTEPLKISMVWTDPKAFSQVVYAGPNNGFVVDDFNVLINDLDLRVTDSQGNTFFPWRLSPDGYHLPALRDGDNSVDNVEQVLIDEPIPGEEYTISITHKADLQNGSQAFSLVVSGVKYELSTELEKWSDITLYPNPAKDFIRIQMQDVAHADLQVLDMQGRQMKMDLSKIDENEIKLEVSGFPAGMYFLKMTKGNQTQMKKFLVK